MDKKVRWELIRDCALLALAASFVFVGAINIYLRFTDKHCYPVTLPHTDLPKGCHSPVDCHVESLTTDFTFIRNPNIKDLYYMCPKRMRN